MNHTASMLYEQETKQPPPPFSQISLEKCLVLPDPVFNKSYGSSCDKSHNSHSQRAVFTFCCDWKKFLVVLLIARKSALHTSSNVHLACLAFCDLVVSLVVQPSYVVYLLLENILHFVPCGLRIVYSQSFWVCYGVSFLTLSSISFEPYAAF